MNTRSKLPTRRKVPTKAKLESGLFIYKIFVKSLFGNYDYILSNEQNSKDLSKLLILYGDNGSGKTTILRLLFFLLSTHNDKGHKSAVAEIVFEEFSIEFSNKIRVVARRQNSNVGSYRYYIYRDNKVISEAYLDADNKINNFDTNADSSGWRYTLECLKDLNLAVYFLADDRKVMNSLKYYDSSSDYTSSNNLDMVISGSKNKLLSKKDFDRERKIELELSIKRLTEWIRSKFIASSSIGETSSQSTYVGILRDIAENENLVTDISQKSLIDVIKHLQAINQQYVELGLVKPLDYEEFYKPISKVTDKQKIALMLSILVPYINSTIARLESLTEIKRIIDSFLRAVNSYFTNKKINFRLDEGFTLTFEGNSPLSFNNLSSGEKQLLLLLINTITATDEATIFIIDEPEISLNIKWQRLLVKTLLDLTSHSKVQFIIATHSIEILTSRRENTIKLNNHKAANVNKI